MQVWIERNNLQQSFEDLSQEIGWGNINFFRKKTSKFQNFEEEGQQQELNIPRFAITRVLRASEGPTFAIMCILQYIDIPMLTITRVPRASEGAMFAMTRNLRYFDGGR